MQDDARKATEQAELGSNAVAPTIRDKWNAAKKENGDADEITLPNGEVVKGHYVLTESGAASASHQATNGFAETEGFPIDENGQSVNDRDYKRDQEAQQVTRSMATDYDQRAFAVACGGEPRGCGAFGQRTHNGWRTGCTRWN